MTLQRLIGLISKVFLVCPFWDEHNHIVIEAFRHNPIAEKFLIPVITSFFINAQFCWKKRPGIPSGPGTFRGPIWSNSLLIYSLEKSLHSAAFISSMIGS
jgi:hypothetical protein